MHTPILASFGTVLVSIVLVLVSLLLIGLVLLQKNRGSGLSGAFGGVGGHTAFGTKTGDMLTWVTVALAVTFLVLNIVGNYIYEPKPMPGTANVAGSAGTGGTSPPQTGASQDTGADSGTWSPAETGDAPSSD